MEYTDQACSYDELPHPHEAVQHRNGEYVRGRVNTNSVESFWLMLKHIYVSFYYRFSQEHLGRYLKEYISRRNLRDLDSGLSNSIDS